MRNFYLFTKDNCPLCVQAKQLIEQTPLAQPVALHEVDIAAQEALMDEYALIVPVLVRETDDAELKWPFDGPRLQAFLQEEPELA